MVEELKLAIKIDDASIEQSLLKQFANAQKMADKVVLDFKNVNFDDKQVEAKFKEMQKKAGQNPIDLTISDNALNMLGQIDKRLTEIFSIGKGKSFIDSSSITADIGKIENKINELDKKYEEAQKKLSSIGSGNISGKDVNLVDNAEFKKLSQEVSELKNQFDDLKTHMQLLDDYTVSTDRFFELQSQVEATTVKVSDLIDKFVELSIAQKTLSSTPQESNISLVSDSEIKTTTNDIIEEQKAIGELQIAFRGLEGSLNGFMSNSGRLATFFTTSPLLARQYADSLGGVYQAMVALGNSLNINAEGRDWNAVEYLGNGSDEASKKIIELRKQIDSLYEQLNASGVPGTGLDGRAEQIRGDFSHIIQFYGDAGIEYNSYIEAVEKGNIIENQENETVKNLMVQLYNLEKAYKAISDAKNNVYGTHTTDEFAELAKANGYDSVMFRNIKDSFDRTKNLTDVGVIFDENQVANVKNVSDQIDNLVSRIDGVKSQHGLNLPINIELPKEISKLEDGSFVNNLTGEIYSNVQTAIESLKELETQAIETEKAIENTSSKTQKKDAFPDKDISASVDSATNSIKEENNVLEQNTQKVKENTQAKEQNANVNFNKYDKRLDSYNGKIDKYKTTIDRFNDGGWTSDEYLKNVQAVKDAVKEYETLLNELKGKDASLVTSDDINRLDNYEKKIKDTIATVTNMSAAEKGYNFVSGQKELDKIHKLLNENSKMSSEAKAKIRAYYTEIESGNPSMSLDRIHGEIMKIYNAEVEAGRAGRSFFDTLKNSGFHKLAAQMSGMFGFYDVINIGKQAISTIVSLDDALLDLKKTTSMSSTELNNFYYSANDVAKQMGVTTKSIIEQASAWSRLGYSSNEQATEMAKLSSKFASISPGMDTDQAQEGMVSIMKAWQINPEDVEKEILDPINQLGNKFAESNNDIVEGMKRSAAALAAVGTDYKDAYSLFTGVQEVLQNSEVAGRALRSISMRIRGYDENSEDGFEQTDDELKNITGDLIDLTKTAQHAQGVSIFKEGSTTEFKSLVDYFGEIHDIWDEMSQKQQNDFLQKAFGKTQAQAGAALIQNYDAVKEALAEIDESAGSADKEMSTVEQTLSYKINALKETWVGCAQQILDRGDLGIAISGLNGVSKVITGLIDNVGLLKTAAMGVAATLSFKNVGGNKMHFPMNILDNIHNLLWIQRFRVCYP